MHYIIDGSNLIYHMKLIKDCNEDIIITREELNKSIAKMLEEKYPQDKASIVYDVHTWGFKHQSKKLNQLKIIFAVGKKEDQPADNLIKNMAANELKKDEVIVVTSDSSLRTDIMFKGIKTMPVDDFWHEYGLYKYW